MTEPVDPSIVAQVAITAAEVAARAQESAQYVAMLTMIQVAVQTLGVLGVALIGVWQFTLKKTMLMLEKNTNSIKDELVAVTASANLAKGKLEGRAERNRENT